MARDWEDRVGEYVDSPRMTRRIKVGREIACTIDGRYGTYATRVDLARKDGDACTCPVGEGVAGCKHTEALRRTYRLHPRSFVDVDTLLGGLAARRKDELLELIRAMVVRAPAALGALGVRGFKDAEPEDSFDE